MYILFTQFTVVLGVLLAIILQLVKKYNKHRTTQLLHNLPMQEFPKDHAA